VDELLLLFNNDQYLDTKLIVFGLK